MDRKSARKHRAGLLPSEARAARGPRLWRTRSDPLAAVWPEIEEMLRREPGLQAVTLLGWLQGVYPGRYEASVRRTLERRVRRWKAQHGPAKEVYFAQVHEPGRLGASDFTHMSSLGVTIAGEPLAHLVYHFVLTHSNWEHVTVCFSESFASLSAGLQNALWALGGVPRRHRTDRMTLAVHADGQAEQFTAKYAALLEHYGLEAEATNPASAHENGDCEQSHRHFKEAVEQTLLLRGSRDFASRAEYERFLGALTEQRNARRQAALANEGPRLRALPSARLETQERRRVRVQRGSTIVVQNNTYSVPARLIGEYVEVRIGVEEIEVWYSASLVQRMPRLRGRSKHHIDYRHIIGWLVRKPGAFARYAFRADLYPTTTFRRAYDSLMSQNGERAERADRDYVQLLHLASQEGESRVEAALQQLLDAQAPLSVHAIRALLHADQAGQHPRRPQQLVGVDIPWLGSSSRRIPWGSRAASAIPSTGSLARRRRWRQPAAVEYGGHRRSSWRTLPSQRRCALLSCQCTGKMRVYSILRGPPLGGPAFLNTTRGRVGRDERSRRHEAGGERERTVSPAGGERQGLRHLRH
jgi:hypothetical protein